MPWAICTQESKEQFKNKNTVVVVVVVVAAVVVVVVVVASVCLFSGAL